MALTPLEKQLLEALIGLRGSDNGFGPDFCGEMPHEEDCQRAMDAIAAAKAAGGEAHCSKCGADGLLTLRGDGLCDGCWDRQMRSYRR